MKFLAFTRDIKRSESRNEITINILAFEDKKVYICRKGKEYDRVANLMLITNHNEKHYIVIKSLSRLLHSSNTKKEKAQYFCINCLQGFNEAHSRDEHYVYCRSNEAVRIEMPNKKPIFSTREVNAHTPSGWCIYSHFFYGDVTNPLTQYRGLDCVSKFCEHIISEAKRLYNSFPEKPMEPLTNHKLKNTNELLNVTFASNHLTRRREG